MAKPPYRTSNEVFADMSKQGLSFEGLLRPVKSNVDEVEFSLGKTCFDWIPIPVGHIENVVPISKYKCGDDEYDYVFLKLKTPTVGIGLVYARLAAAPKYEKQIGDISRNNTLLGEVVKPLLPGRCWDTLKQEWYDCPPYRG